MRLSEADRLAISALLPCSKELADAAKEVAPYLLPGEALDAGDLARVMMLEAIEEGAALVPDDGDDGPDEPPPVSAFDTLLDQLAALCLGMARERLLRAP